MTPAGSAGAAAASSGWHWTGQDTLLHAFQRVLDAAPDRIFLDFSGKHYSYWEFDRLATRLAHELKRLGVRPGDTVMTLLDNNVDAVTSWFASNRIGAICVPINTALRGEFLRHQLDDASGPIVICEASYLSRLAEVADRLPSVRLILRRGAIDQVPACAIPIESLDEHRGDSKRPSRSRPSPGTRPASSIRRGPRARPRAACRATTTSATLRPSD